MPDLLACLSLALECAALFGLFLLAARASPPRFAVLLYRCSFAIALGAPFTLLLQKREALITTGQWASIAPATASVQTASVLSTSPDSLGYAIFAVWLLGAAFVAWRYLSSLARLQGAFARATAPAPRTMAAFGELRDRFFPGRAVALRVSSNITVPCTFGWLRPKILLPRDIAESSVQATLAHELCHARSGDAFWLAIGHVACALHWFNPIIWMCKQRHDREIELVCDDDAAEDVDAYVTTLIASAQRLALAAAATMSAAGVGARVRALLNREAPMPRPTHWMKLSAAAASLAALGVLGSVQLVAAQPIAELAAGAPAPGNGRFYLDTSDGIRVDDRAGRFACWDNASCLFETRLDEVVALRVTSSRQTQWQGCGEVSQGGQVCTIRITETPAHVTVRSLH